jgi:ketosteroid isomerase-like protein
MPSGVGLRFGVNLGASDTMPGMKHALLPIAVLVVLAGCSPGSAPIVENREANASSLRAAEEAAIKAFASKDLDQIVSAYSADANLMLPNSPVFKGDALRALVKTMVADPNFSMQFRTDQVEAAKSGELGYTRGEYAMTMSDPATKNVLREKGKYVTIYARQTNGSWKIIEDITNADGPASPAGMSK